MKATLKDVLAAIPDFEDLSRLSDNIAELLFKKLLLDKDIKAGESAVFKRCMLDSGTFVGGKPMPVSMIENAYKFGGMDGELLPLRTELAEVTSKLEKAKLQLDIYKNMMDIWRTLSANERSSAL